jgi:hypothetical protein
MGREKHRTTRRENIAASHDKNRSRSSSTKRKVTSPSYSQNIEKKHKHNTASLDNLDIVNSDTYYNYIIKDKETDNTLNTENMSTTVKCAPNPTMETSAPHLNPSMSEHLVHTPSPGSFLTDVDIARIVNALKLSMAEEINNMVSMHVQVATEQLREDISDLKKEVESLKQKHKKSKMKQDDAEQYSRKNSVRISNYKEKSDEETSQIVVDIAKKVNVSIDRDDIDNSHRVGEKKGGKEREIIVKFKSFRSKLEFMKLRKELKNKNEKIFINDDLTKKRSKIAYEARELKKDPASNVKGTWVYNGCIYIQTKTTGDRVKITSKEELEMYRK